MIPLSITLRQDGANAPEAGSSANVETALYDLTMALEGMNLYPHLNKIMSPHAHSNLLQIDVTPNFLDSTYISQFIEIITSFIGRFPDIMMEMEFSGNKIRIDSLSIIQAEKIIRRLTEKSFNIYGSNIVVGSDNEVKPAAGWPRRKK